MATKKTTALVKVDPKATAQAIFDALNNGMREAVRLYREFVEAGGDAMELRANSSIPASVWAKIDSYACGRSDLRLGQYSEHVQRALGELPAKAQAKAIEDGVPVLAVDGSEITVPVYELTQSMTRQVFAANHVRTLSEQAAYLKAQKAVPSKPAPMRGGFEVKGGKIVVHGDSPEVILTRRDLLNMLQALGD